MYVSSLRFKNVAPIGDISLRAEAGQVINFSSLNGKGKTTILSYLADSFFEIARKADYSDVFTDNTKYYRIASAGNISEGASYSLAYIRFKEGESEYDYLEVVGTLTEQEYDKDINYPNKIPFHRLSQILSSSTSGKIVILEEIVARKLFNDNILVFFPSDRTERPVWYNDAVLKNYKYNTKSRFNNELGKNIEAQSVAPEIANWILDVILDNQIYATDFYSATLKDALNLIIKLIMQFKAETARLGIGQRRTGTSRVVVMNDSNGASNVVSPSIFHLSSGEISLLVIFAEILRHYDASTNPAPITDLNTMQGIVLIDEVDKHLHIKSQMKILPELIELFPNIQFIVSSHSPFFALGGSRKLEERFRIIDITSGLDLPPGNVEELDEVNDVVLEEQENYKKLYGKLSDAQASSKKVRVVSEGHNVAYIKKAIEIFAPEILDEVYICTGAETRTGDQQLKNAYEVMSVAGIEHKVLFVWDCDSKSKIDPLVETRTMHKFVFDVNSANTKAVKGIENLFSKTQLSADMYDQKENVSEYGGKIVKTSFNKDRFKKKMLDSNSSLVYKNFKPLVEKIKRLM
jgi:hypothetical protein